MHRITVRKEQISLYVSQHIKCCLLSRGVAFTAVVLPTAVVALISKLDSGFGSWHIMFMPQASLAEASLIQEYLVRNKPLVTSISVELYTAGNLY